MHDPTSKVTVSAIVPLLNDASGIEACLEAVVHQESQLSDIVEVLVADGGSTDGSRAVVEAFALTDKRVRLLDNPDGYVPQAMNLGIEASHGAVIVRVDSHTVLAPDYVDRAIETLAASGADVVGGPMRPAGDGGFGAAAAWALSSRWGVGGSQFHLDDYEGETESAYMGVFPRATFQRFGLYNPEFRRNQDDELTYRIREQAGRVWLSPSLRSTYTPRGTPQGLLKQFRGYGRYKPLVLLAHPAGARVRHLIPPATAVAWLLIPAGLVWPIVLVPASIHLVATTAAAATGRSGRLHARLLALLAMHLGYGFGFLNGLAHLAAGERPGNAPVLASQTD